MKEYFPDYDPGQLPERFFLLGLLSTYKPVQMQELIDDERKQRALTNLKEDDDMIMMTLNFKSDMLNLLPQKSKFLEPYFHLLQQHQARHITY